MMGGKSLEHWRDRAERAEALLNTPELHEFRDAVLREAAHQRARWGEEHDARKSPYEWAALVSALLGKAVHAVWKGDREKLLHHIITIAAACANWHAHAVRGSGGVPADLVPVSGPAWPIEDALPQGYAAAPAASPRCRVCGCMEFSACMTEDGPCYWVEPDLCSGCVEEGEK